MNNLASPVRVLYSLQCVCLLTTFILYVPVAVKAQDLDNGGVSGRVLDQNGAAIPGAKVSLVSLKTQMQRDDVSDGAGRYRVIQLEPGTYNLTVSSTGFAKAVRRALVLQAGQNLELDITLYPAGIEVDPVTVNQTDVPAVDTSRTLSGGNIDSREIETLPNATRSLLDLLFTLPGVTEEPLSTRDLAEDRGVSGAVTPEEAGIFALSGGPAYSNNLTIDGLDNNDDRAARERFLPAVDAVEEVQIITNQFSAEYGRASGGRINFRTRSGAKTLRGRAFYLFRDEALNANTFRNNSLGLNRLPLQEHNFGFTLGGPLSLRRCRIRRQTFFFIAYEFGKQLDSALIDTLVPIQQSSLFRLPPPTNLRASRREDASQPALSADVAPYISWVNTPLMNHTTTARIDHQFSDAHNAALVYQSGRSRNLRMFEGGNRLAEALQARTRNSDSLSYTDNFVFVASGVNQARMQFSRLQPGLAARSNSPVVLITINDPLEADDPARRSGTLVAGSSTAGATERRETRFQIQDVLAYSTGSHSVKLGFDLQRIDSIYIDLTDASGTFSFASAGDFLAGIPNRFRQNFQTQSRQQNIYLGLFVQDEWRPASNLVLSYGLRYEKESILGDTNNFGPRLSLAYDPFKSGKTAVRFGAGVFYNRVLLRTIDDFTLGTRQLFFDTNALRNPITGRIFSADERRAFIRANLRFPETLQSNSPLVHDFGMLNTDFSRRLDPSLRIPDSYQLSFGIERDVGGNLVIETNYTFNRGLHLWREFNANAAALPSGYKNFSEYLSSRDFANFRNGPLGLRPLYNASSAGELVRFVVNPSNPLTPNVIERIAEFGVPISVFNLNSISSATVVEVALAALTNLRPDPSRGEVEQLVSLGNSSYHAITVSFQNRFQNTETRLHFTLRGAYTLSRLIDDGIVNTSDALQPGNFRGERARSLLDRRHRFVLSGIFDLPQHLGAFAVAPIFRLGSGAPFNISLGGIDRNLDDVGNDRPIYTGDLRLLRWRRPGETNERGLLTFFALPTIGQTGNLPRNAGIGPGLFMLDLNVTREFRLGRRSRLRASIEFDNVLNKTVFSFGSEFINFNAFAPTATPEQRQAFLDSFLVATRTLRQRQIRLGLRLDF